MTNSEYEVEPNCIEELLGYMMEQEEIDANYYMFILTRYFEYRRRNRKF